jgi:DNA-binding response OmpR family regulator
MNGSSVLVVDDDKDFLAAVARVLRTAGFDVRTTSDSRAVPDLIRARKPQVVITDIMMPERDGVEVIAEIRKTTRGIRILAVSGRRQIGTVDLLGMAQALGADDGLMKPFDGDELVAKVNALVAPRGG